MFRFIVLCIFVIAALSAAAGAETQPSGKTASVHAGFLYPNGVDVVGYTVEHDLSNHIYGYYTFGLPSLVAAGMTYYSNYDGNGIAATVGVGIGSVLYTSLVYQLRLEYQHYLKVGGGYTTGIAYTGPYPALSYEYRFR